jgi:hypothetical protein
MIMFACMNLFIVLVENVVFVDVIFITFCINDAIRDMILMAHFRRKTCVGHHHTRVMRLHWVD